MDVLSDVLARARARGAVFSVLGRHEPWGLGFSGERPLVVHVVLRGEARLDRQGRRIPITSGDVLLVRAGDRYVLAGGASVQPEPIEVARANASDAALRTAEMVVLCGAYTVDGAPGLSLLDSLPDELVVPVARQSGELRLMVGILTTETSRATPGQQTVLDRALDLMLVQVLRDAAVHGLWSAPGWYRALSDKGLSAVLAAVHQAPQQPWTVASMATVAHLSRAGFARRFAQIVGETPAAYLTRLRLERATERLANSTATIAAIAVETGFASEFSLTAAFKRRYGISPGAWRRTRG